MMNGRLELPVQRVYDEGESTPADTLLPDQPAGLSPSLLPLEDPPHLLSLHMVQSYLPHSLEVNLLCM